MECEVVLKKTAKVVKEIKLLDKWRFKAPVIRRQTGAHIQYFDGYKFEIDGKWYIHSTKDNPDIISESDTVYMSVWGDDCEKHFAVANQPYSGADECFILVGEVLEYYCSTCY